MLCHWERLIGWQRSRWPARRRHNIRDLALMLRRRVVDQQNQRGDEGMKETGRREVTDTGTIIAAGETGQDLDLGTVVMAENDAAIETPRSTAGVGAHRGDRAETMTTENTNARAAREDEAQTGTRRDGEETEVLAMKENHEDTEIEQARTNGV